MQGHLTRLPYELLDEILSLVGFESLKTLRCTCSYLRELVTGRLFKTLHLSPNNESQRKLRTLLDGDSVPKHVRNIHLYIFNGPYSISAASSDSGVQEYELGESDGPLPSTEEQILSLLRFPNLRHVALCFTKYITQERFDTLGFREATASLFFSTLVASSLQLHKLSILGLQGKCIEDPKTLAMIPKVLCGLQELHLQIANRLIPYFGFEIDCELALTTLGSQTNDLLQIPSTWLNPTMSSLQHLTLSSGDFFGLYPKLELSGIHFPNLESLALGKYTFFHDEQVDWIVSHAPTLRSLYLHDCPILHATIVHSQEDVEACHPALLHETWEVITRRNHIGDSMRYLYPRRWHDYFTIFRTKLTHLRRFHFGYSKSLKYMFPLEAEEMKGYTDAQLAPARYSVFDSVDHSKVVLKLRFPEEEGYRPLCVDEDREALEALLEKIGQSYSEPERWLDSNCSVED